MDVNLNESENPLNYLEDSEEEEVVNTDSDVDEMEYLTTQIDDLYSTYKTNREEHEKKYLEELEKKKGLPAQKQRELNKLDELYKKEVEMTKEDLMKKAKEEVSIGNEYEIQEEELEKDSENESNPEEEEEEEEESEGEQNEVSENVRTQRWFSDPMFADLSAPKIDEDSDDELIKEMKNKKRASEKRELPLAVRLQAYSNH